MHQAEIVPILIKTDGVEGKVSWKQGWGEYFW